MKIAKQTDSLIILKERDLWLILFFLIFFAAGMITLFAKQLSAIFPNAYFNPNIPIWLSIMFIICGIVSIFFLREDTVTLDKLNNKLIIDKKLLFIRKLKSHDEYNLNDVKKIEIVRGYSLQMNEGKMQNSYNLLAILGNGQEVSLYYMTGGTYVAGIEIPPKAKSIGEKIAAFLNVPFSERSVQPISSAETLKLMKETMSEMSKNA